MLVALTEYAPYCLKSPANFEKCAPEPEETAIASDRTLIRFYLFSLIYAGHSTGCICITRRIGTESQCYDLLRRFLHTKEGRFMQAPCRSRPLRCAIPLLKKQGSRQCPSNYNANHSEAPASLICPNRYSEERRLHQVGQALTIVPREAAPAHRSTSR